jgi:hypothetical protein
MCPVLAQQRPISNSSDERGNLGGNGDLKHRGLRFGPGLNCGALDGVEIVKACSIAAVALCQRHDVNAGDIEAGNAGGLFEFRDDRLDLRFRDWSLVGVAHLLNHR